MAHNIFHVDFNCFYAAVEMQRRPEIRNKPVAVCGSQEDRHGIVLTANYFAKTRGIKTGMAIWQARQCCPDLVVLPPDMREYIRISRLARDIALMKEMGLKAYRFSASWLRIMPEEGKVNEKGLQFYRNLVNELVNAGIEPMCTLFHWNLPMWVPAARCSGTLPLTGPTSPNGCVDLLFAVLVPSSCPSKIYSTTSSAMYYHTHSTWHFIRLYCIFYLSSGQRKTLVCFTLTKSPFDACKTPVHQIRFSGMPDFRRSEFDVPASFLLGQ